MGGGTPGIPGTVVVMSAVHTGMGVNQSMFMIGATTLVQVPLSHGQAGQLTNTFFAISGVLHAMTVNFYAWTPGTLVFTGLSALGQSLPNVTAKGSFNLTAHGGGTVTLVSPSKITIDSAGGIKQRTVGVTTLVLTFVPEPSTLLLLGGSALVLAAAARRAKR